MKAQCVVPVPRILTTSADERHLAVVPPTCSSTSPRSRLQRPSTGFADHWGIPTRADSRSGALLTSGGGERVRRRSAVWTTRLAERVLPSTRTSRPAPSLTELVEGCNWVVSRGRTAWAKRRASSVSDLPTPRWPRAFMRAASITHNASRSPHGTRQRRWRGIGLMEDLAGEGSQDGWGVVMSAGVHADDELVGMLDAGHG